MRAFAVVMFVPLLLTACGPTARVEVPVTHPANPDAVESPVPVQPKTLAVGPTVLTISPPGSSTPVDDEHTHHLDHLDHVDHLDHKKEP